jgi:hypothetical protein
MLLLLPVHLAGQAVGTLTGIVTAADGTPLAQARIRVAGTSSATLSGTDGRFQVVDVSAGARTIDVRMIGYLRVLLPIRVAAAETVDVRVILALDPVLLKAVDVAGEPGLSTALQGFQERRARGIGHFFNRQEIARIQPRVITDVLRRVPGVQIQSSSTPFGPNDMVRMARTAGVTGTRPCPVLFYVNGTPFQVVGDVSINQYILPEEVVAIEVYAGMSEIPPQFQSNLLNARCGVIVIWTRSGNEDDRPPKRSKP